MKKLAWSIIFIALIVLVSGLTVLTMMYTDEMLEVYIFFAVYLLFIVLIGSIAWAINEVRK